MADQVKVAIIGAGSIAFSLTITADLLTYSEFNDVNLSLMDIDQERLASTARLVEKAIADNRLHAKLDVTTDRKKAIRDADYVITSIRSGGMVAYRLDLEIPAKYGIEQGVGDTLGPGGIFYGLKNASAVVDIAHDIEEESPNALLINYTNPMAIVSWAVSDLTKVKYVGLCHSVPGTARTLSLYAGIPYEELEYVAAGINHMAWFVKLMWKGNDLYPMLKEKLSDPRVYTDPTHPAYNDLVRVEVFKAFGYYSAEDSNHLSEYLPYFRKNQELLKRYRILNHKERLELMDRRATRDRESRDRLEKLPKIELNRSNEYAAQIIHAIETKTPTRVYGNVKNHGLISNLPPESVVELPVLVDGSGIHPTYVGELPPHLAALNLMNINAQELVVKALKEGSREAVIEALLLDPLTSSILTIPEIERMGHEMLEAEAPYLPKLKRIGFPSDWKRTSAPLVFAELKAWRTSL